MSCAAEAFDPFEGLSCFQGENDAGCIPVDVGVDRSIGSESTVHADRHLGVAR